MAPQNETHPIHIMRRRFGVKYTCKEDKQYLPSILTRHYEVTVKDKGSSYLDITIDWDYNKRQVHLSIPGYAFKALKYFGHTPSAQNQNQSYPHVPPSYRSRMQYSNKQDDSRLLLKTDKKKSCRAFSFTAQEPSTAQ